MSEFQQVVKEGANKVGKGIKRGLLILLILALAGTGVFIWVSNWTYSEGTRAGLLIKVSKKGVVWKTYEGQLNLGGVTSTPESGLTGNIWDFSIPKSQTFQEMSNYEGQQVRVHYRQVFKNMPWQGKTEYFVYKIEPIKGRSPGN